MAVIWVWGLYTMVSQKRIPGLQTHTWPWLATLLSLVAALAAGGHSQLLLSLPTVICHPCHRAGVFVGLH